MGKFIIIFIAIPKKCEDNDKQADREIEILNFAQSVMRENIVDWYFTIALMVFCFWSIAFIQDSTTPKNHRLSWLVLLIAPLFWPLVLPISGWELTTKALNHRFLHSRQPNWNRYKQNSQ